MHTQIRLGNILFIGAVDIHTETTGGDIQGGPTQVHTHEMVFSRNMQRDETELNLDKHSREAPHRCTP